jgi:hypothetical protein
MTSKTLDTIKTYNSKAIITLFGFSQFNSVISVKFNGESS